MVLWLCIRWWYSDGWRWAVQRAIVERLQWCNETFSITALMRTLFSPFKQTHRNPGGSVDIRIHVFVDNIVSRFVGFFARGFVIFMGLLASALVLVSGALFVIFWPLIPLSIPISLAMMVFGVGR